MANQRKMSKKVSHPGKIWVVAVNPFTDLDLQTLWHHIKPLAESAGARLIAAYVLAPASLNWTGDFSGPWMKKYLPLSVAKLDEAVPIETIEKRVIPCRDPGMRSASKALDSFARRKKAECLVVSTHSRKGLERFAMGSFAETLILSAKTPVLIVNPAEKIPHHVKRILLPIDLSPKCQKFAESVAEYAKRFDAEIILYHKQADPLDPIIQQGVYSLGGGWVSVQDYLDTDLEEKNKQIARIEGKIRRHGVKVSHVFDSSPGALIDSIERAAEEKDADMVSVLTQSGEWSALLLGSVARGLVRHSHIPVLVRR